MDVALTERDTHRLMRVRWGDINFTWYLLWQLVNMCALQFVGGED